VAQDEEVGPGIFVEALSEGAEVGLRPGLDVIRVEVVEQPRREGHLDPLADPLDGGAWNVLAQLAGLAVHLVADDGARRATHRGADDRAFRGGASDLADHAAQDRSAGGAEHQAALGVAGAAGRAESNGEGEGQQESTTGGTEHGGPRGAGGSSRSAANAKLEDGDSP
jgi:hypothetical protein